MSPSRNDDGVHTIGNRSILFWLVGFYLMLLQVNYSDSLCVQSECALSVIFCMLSSVSWIDIFTRPLMRL